MSLPTHETVESLRRQYPAGTRVELLAPIDDPYEKRLTVGCRGTIEFVDDAANIHTRWDCGSGLSLIIGVDQFRVVSEKEAEGRG